MPLKKLAFRFSERPDVMRTRTAILVHPCNSNLFLFHFLFFIFYFLFSISHFLTTADVARGGPPSHRGLPGLWLAHLALSGDSLQRAESASSNFLLAATLSPCCTAAALRHWCSSLRSSCYHQRQCTADPTDRTSSPFFFLPFSPHISFFHDFYFFSNFFLPSTFSVSFIILIFNWILSSWSCWRNQWAGETCRR